MTEEEKDLEEFQTIIREVEKLNPLRAYNILMDFAVKTDEKNKNDRFERLFVTWLGTRKDLCKREKQNMKEHKSKQEKNEKNV